MQQEEDEAKIAKLESEIEALKAKVRDPKNEDGQTSSVGDQAPDHVHAGITTDSFVKALQDLRDKPEAIPELKISTLPKASNLKQWFSDLELEVSGKLFALRVPRRGHSRLGGWRLGSYGGPKGIFRDLWEVLERSAGNPEGSLRGSLSVLVVSWGTPWGAVGSRGGLGEVLAGTPPNSPRGVPRGGTRDGMGQGQTKARILSVPICP